MRYHLSIDAFVLWASENVQAACSGLVWFPPRKPYMPWDLVRSTYTPTPKGNYALVKAGFLRIVYRLETWRIRRVRRP